MMDAWESHKPYALFAVIVWFERIQLLFFFFCLSGTNLVMKVDALLAAAPKAEIRRDVKFLKESHRLAIVLGNWPSCIWKIKHATTCNFQVGTSLSVDFGYISSPCSISLLSVLQLSPRENEVFFDVVAIVDPLTRAAQKMSPLLIVSYRRCPMKTVFNTFFFLPSEQ